MDEKQLKNIVDAVVQELLSGGAQSSVFPGDVAIPVSQPEKSTGQAVIPPAASNTLSQKPLTTDLKIDLPDPTLDQNRYQPLVKNAKDPAALSEIIRATPARIGVGRAGPRYKTSSLLLFQGDHAITQDALYRDIDKGLLDEFGLFTVQTRISEDKEQYLLRPDLGRQLSDDAKQMIAQKCTKSPNIQVVVGDGLSAAAIEANLRQILPVMKQGVQAAGLTMGVPFHVKYCRVGVMNDIGDIIQPDVLILLIGERPGLGRAESMSAYMGYRPKSGNNDADRDVICNIFENGGTNPLEAGAFIVQTAQKMIKYQASGVKLKLAVK